MKPRVLSRIAILAVSLTTLVSAADPFSLTLKPAGSRVELSWPTVLTNGSQQAVFPEYEVQSSTDLTIWTPIGGKVVGLPGLSGPRLSLSLDRAFGSVFYRVRADTNAVTTNETGEGGAEVLGFDSGFSARLSELGQLSVEDFATNAANVSYLPHLTWDPTTAQFWTNFSSTNIHYDNVPILSVSYPTPGTTNIPYNYVLDTNELALFKTNGFVVSERLGSASFGDAYYRVFNADLPVFVTADSVLHAWHRSYQSILAQLEDSQLSTLLGGIVSDMSYQVPQIWQQYGQGPLRNSILDADYFLTVACSLWYEYQQPSAVGNPDVDHQVALTLMAITNQVPVQDFPLFGSNRSVDFSQFIPRGHYTQSYRLRDYFLTMMWCSQIDLRLATFWPNKEDDIRQLGTAIVLRELLVKSGRLDSWSALERVTRTLVGITDSMTFAQLGDLLSSEKIGSLADVPDLLTLTNLQTRLLSGELGFQAIQGDFFLSPFGPEQLKLPRSFTVCGQKFVMDSWAFSQVVFDRVLWTPDYGTNIIFGKVIRRKPSCLDNAFAVLGNSQVVPELVARMMNDNGDPFRDSPHLPYQHNLLALRQVIDSQSPAVWTNNIYTAWLNALRALSAPTTDPAYPESMRTRAWAMKTLNTQLASWTQLRHDTVLYAQPSYSGVILCSYPAGFVEPRPVFWHCMKTLADTAAEGIASLSLTGTVDQLRTNELAFLANFAARMSSLQGISEKELAQQPLSPQETDFLKNVVEIPGAYSNYRQWNGWYPKLFYPGSSFVPTFDIADCDLWDALVTDVHTDPPDGVLQDPGAVVHEGVANVNLLLVAIDNGPDRMVYAGPVLSHYEFEVPGANRMTDAQWKSSVLVGIKPPQPDWTKSYLVPGTIPIPPGNQGQ